MKKNFLKCYCLDKKTEKKKKKNVSLMSTNDKFYLKERKKIFDVSSDSIIGIVAVK